jgi:hypothetical protein
MQTSAVLRALGRAEGKLGIDGLFLLLQSDGSGCVRRFDDTPVFLFDDLEALTSWMRSPQVVSYNEEGERVTRAAATTA